MAYISTISWDQKVECLDKHGLNPIPGDFLQIPTGNSDDIFPSLWQHNSNQNDQNHIQNDQKTDKERI